MSEQESNRGDGWLLVIYSFFGVALPLYFGAVEGDWITGGLLLFLCLTSYVGFQFGAVRMIALAAGSLAAFFLARPLAAPFEPKIRETFLTEGLLNRLICVSTAAVVVLLIVFVLLDLGIRRVRRWSPTFAAIDRLLGFLAGTVQGAAVGALLIGGILISDRFLETARPTAKEAAPASPRMGYVAHRIQAAAASFRRSSVGDYVTSNPSVTQLPVMQQMQDVSAVLQDERGRSEFLANPRVRKLQELPTIARTMELVDRDAELRVLKDDGLSEPLVAHLVRHPEMLEIVDQTNWSTELSTLAGELQTAISEVGARVKQRNQVEDSTANQTS